MLSAGPLAKGAGWTNYVNGVESEADLTSMRQSLNRGAPYEDEKWRKSTARKLGLESSLRPRGRLRQIKQNVPF
jgi:putative transposase